MMDLLPTHAVFTSGQDVTIELPQGAPDAPAILRLLHLGQIEDTVGCEPGTRLGRFRSVEDGCYGVELVDTDTEDVLARCAIQVGLEAQRMRYGFVASYAPGKDLEAVARMSRTLHLTDVQFYDWAYRHADLLGGGNEYRDALGQPISLRVVRNLIETLQSVGTRALGYAAVYGVGDEEWSQWCDEALLDDDGAPHSLGTFLQLVDPSGRRWLTHFTQELFAVQHKLGFDGFHLDQYGYPKHAVRPDGTHIDVARSFATLIDRVRETLPSAHLVFNNVNDFPTWATASATQDAVYIEPWEPNTELADLAELAVKARLSGGDRKPVVLAAYLSCYRGGDTAGADLAAQFAMATLFSHGATQLLFGEGGNLLTDPYYVKNNVAASSTLAMARRWYDFLVEHDALLMDSGLVDVTASMAGAYNDDIDIEAPVPVTHRASVGVIWRRIVRRTRAQGSEYVLHMINLVGQHDLAWDSVRQTPTPLEGIVLHIKASGTGEPHVWVADPDGIATLTPVPVRRKQGYWVADLPKLAVWQIVRIHL